MSVPSDEELFFRLRNFEDNFVERKTEGDSKDWCRTVVAFANSTPVGYPAILFIGVMDDGQVERSVNLDSLQKSLARVLGRVYPPPYYLTRVLKENDKQFLAVIVPGSSERPHFSGPAYVRVGSQTVEASAAQFTSLIAERQSKVYELRKWIGKSVALEHRTIGTGGHAYAAIASICIRDCNQFFVTYDSGAPDAAPSSLPLTRIALSFYHQATRLKLEVSAQ